MAWWLRPSLRSRRSFKHTVGALKINSYIELIQFYVCVSDTFKAFRLMLHDSDLSRTIYRSSS